ncbi:MAG: hypothetical protein N2517_07825 [Ignavibacteria bacterium]|nr:hypothetical protein [Ignavibacteria bacterium]
MMLSLPPKYQKHPCFWNDGKDAVATLFAQAGKPVLQFPIHSRSK